MTKLDYCIIRDSNNKKSVYVYAVHPNAEKLDKSIVENQFFLEFSNELENRGFSKLESMTFHASIEKDSDIKRLTAELDHLGFYRNKALEKKLKTNYDILKSFREKKNGNIIKHHYRKPKKGQKILINFYLFVKTGPEDDENMDLQIDYDTSYTQNANDYKRFFIKVSTSKFLVKKVDGDKIHFESEKTIKELVSEINSFYQISLLRDENIKPDLLVLSNPDDKEHFMDSIEILNIMEVKKMLESQDKILILMELPDDYQYLRNISKFLGEEKKKFDQESLIPLVLIKELILETNNKFKIEIEDLCEAEEYESAAIYQSYIDFFNKKLNLIEKRISRGEQDMGGEEYHKIFAIKEYERSVQKKSVKK